MHFSGWKLSSIFCKHFKFWDRVISNACLTINEKMFGIQWHDENALACTHVMIKILKKSRIVPGKLHGIKPFFYFIILPYSFDTIVC